MSVDEGFFVTLVVMFRAGGGEAEEWSDDDQPDNRLMKPDTRYKNGRISGTTQFDPDSTVFVFRELFESWCTEKKNGCIVAGYCVEVRTR